MSRKKKSLSEQVESETTGTVEKTQSKKSRRKSYVLDLRIHTPASLGYLGVEGIDTAPAMVRLAKVKGLDVIAVTDFYSGDFIDPIMEAAQESSVTVIPGVVIRCTIPTCNDVVLSCLFPQDFRKLQIEEFMLALGIPRSVFGKRNYVVDRPLHEILQQVEQRNGAVIPSRMDKTPYRNAAIPILVEEYGFRAFDLAFADTARMFKKRWPKIKFQMLSFSNASALAQVGSRISRVKLPDAEFASIRTLVAREMQPLA